MEEGKLFFLSSYCSYTVQCLLCYKMGRCHDLGPFSSCCIRLPRSFAFSRQSREHKIIRRIEFFCLGTRSRMSIAHPPAPVLLANRCDQSLLFGDHYGISKLHLLHIFPSVAWSAQESSLLRSAFLFHFCCHDTHHNSLFYIKERIQKLLDIIYTYFLLVPHSSLLGIFQTLCTRR